MRYDHASREGVALTTRTGVRVCRAPATAVFADFSEGYKLPSLFALAYPVIANPDLEPERGRTLTIGVEQSVGAGQLRAAFFQSRFKNLIDLDRKSTRLNSSH